MNSSTSSSRARVVALCASFVATLGAIVAAVTLCCWDRLVQAGDRELSDRPAGLVHPERRKPGVPLAVFLGDSTLQPSYAYPRLLQRQLDGTAELRVFCWKGFEPFDYYLLAGRALELGPRAVVILAQLRVFWLHEPLWYPDLLTLLPPRELPRAVLLPFHERDVSLPRLVLASLFGSFRETSEAWLRAFVGARLVAKREPGLHWLVPSRTPLKDPRELTRLRRERFRRFATPIFAGHPAVEALAATVEQVTRAGARGLVVVSPVPVERLTEAGLYDEGEFAARIDVIRRAVEAEGGELLDLHAILHAGDFRDDFGHMTGSGSRRVALSVGPWLRDALGLPARGKARGPGRERVPGPRRAR